MIMYSLQPHHSGQIKEMKFAKQSRDRWEKVEQTPRSIHLWFVHLPLPLTPDNFICPNGSLMPGPTSCPDCSHVNFCTSSKHSHQKVFNKQQFLKILVVFIGLSPKSRRLRFCKNCFSFAFRRSEVKISPPPPHTHTSTHFKSFLLVLKGKKL